MTHPESGEPTGALGRREQRARPRHSRRQSTGGRSRGLIRLAGCVAVAGAASVGLLAASHTSLTTTASLVTPGEMAGWRGTYQSELCLRAEFEHAVPKGAAVYVGTEYSVTGQMLLEAATLWAHPVSNRASARWIASLRTGPGCFGYTLEAHRVP